MQGPGSCYRYLVDGKAFPDPASRRQPEGVHGPSEVIDPEAYDWRDVEWRGRPWEEIVIYELHLGTFSGSGDFAGAIRHLDHIVELGATAVELMPIAEFPGRRDWGYDGVFLYAPASPYGRPEELKQLVEACHSRGLAIFLDVVYNHFGPEGNYLPAIAPCFFTDRHHTPWGAAIDFAGPDSRPVRDFFINNALYWLDRVPHRWAASRRRPRDIRRERAGHNQRDRPDDPAARSPIAKSISILENDLNQSHYLQRTGGRVRGYNAQWDDDLHHILHVLVTGDTSGYYADYANEPARHLGRALAEGLAYQGEPSQFRDGKPRGEPSGELPATAFVGFLQNHDQIGNHPFGTRISMRAGEAELHAAVAIVLLSPQIPLLFMGEEWASLRPFAFFCDFEPGLRDAVREGRRREFAHFPEFQDEAARDWIPDPTTSSSFEMSRLDWSEPRQEPHSSWLARYRRLLDIRMREIVPRLRACRPLPALIGCWGKRPSSLSGGWAMARRLALLANFANSPVLGDLPKGRLVYSSAEPGAPFSAAFFLIEQSPNAN